MLDYLDDIAADLRVLAHVADWRALSGPDFFSLAMRLPYYSGVLRARLLEELREDEQRTKAVAEEARGAQVIAELEDDGWIERG